MSDKLIKILLLCKDIVTIMCSGEFVRNAVFLLLLVGGGFLIFFSGNFFVSVWLSIICLIVILDVVDWEDFLK